jgi:RNA polymerase sigma-B factor
MVTTRIETAPLAGWQILTASGALDCAVAPTLRQTLLDLLDTGARAVVVDLSGVTLLDCACINAVVDTRSRAKPRRADLHVVGASGRVRRVLEITGAVRELAIDAPGAAGSGAGGFGRGLAVRMVEATLAARAVLPAGDARRQLLRNRAVELSLPLAEQLAGHYRQTRQSGDDLSQVAAVGLLKAVDRYDPARGAGFLGFAVPTILGELRRHFRDHTWGVHVPRHLQELRMSINRATEAMTQRLRRAPTAGELAEQLDAPREEVTEAMVAAQGYLPASLSQPVGDGMSGELGDLIGAPDEALDRVDHHESLVPMMAALPDHEQRVLAYRFYGNLTQTEIAGLLGVSQMQVSRLQSRALNRLREGLLADG